MDNGERVFFSRDQVIFREGDPADGMFILLDGAVELKKIGDKGATLLRTVSVPNDFFGELALIDGKPRSASAVAIQPTSLLVVDGSTFEKLVLSNGGFAMKIIKALSDRIRRTNIQLQELADMDLRARVGLGIMDFSLRFGRKAPGDARVIGLADMRDWVNGHLGVSREEIDSVVFRLIKSGELTEAAPRGDEKGNIMVSGAFIRSNDRRHLVDGVKVPRF